MWLGCNTCILPVCSLLLGSGSGRIVTVWHRWSYFMYYLPSGLQVWIHVLLMSFCTLAYYSLLTVICVDIHVCHSEAINYPEWVNKLVSFNNSCVFLLLVTTVKIVTILLLWRVTEKKRRKRAIGLFLRGRLLHDERPWLTDQGSVSCSTPWWSWGKSCSFCSLLYKWFVWSRLQALAGSCCRCYFCYTSGDLL